MAAPKELGRNPNGMGERRLSCGCVKTTSWKYHSARSTFSSKSSVHQISAVPSKTAERSVLYTNISLSCVMDKGLFEASEEGTPQGGPLSPLLSNIMLNELDKELERRGLPFVRYADDSMIFCKSKRAAMRVKESITRFIENALYLKVNKEKTVVSYVRGVKYLGYSFYVMKGKCQLTVHPKSKAKMKSRLKELTSRSNGWGYAKRKQKLKEYIRGWVGYYHLANMKRLLLETDEWLRRRIRMCIWKAWKKPKTKVANLIKCGINKYQAYEWGNTRKGYWRIADSYILHKAITNEHLCRAGYATLMEAYLEWYPK